MAKYKRRRDFTAQEPDKYEKIDGKRYEFHSQHYTKSGTIKEIKKLRKNGYSARSGKFIIPSPPFSLYAVYKRKRT